MERVEAFLRVGSEFGEGSAERGDAREGVAIGAGNGGVGGGVEGCEDGGWEGVGEGGWRVGVRGEEGAWGWGDAEETGAGEEIALLELALAGRRRVGRVDVGDGNFASGGDGEEGVEREHGTREGEGAVGAAAVV